MERTDQKKLAKNKAVYELNNLCRHITLNKNEVQSYVFSAKNF